jgi:hypothetical protein
MKIVCISSTCTAEAEGDIQSLVQSQVNSDIHGVKTTILTFFVARSIPLVFGTITIFFLFLERSIRPPGSQFRPYQFSEVLALIMLPILQVVYVGTINFVHFRNVEQSTKIFKHG